jgi:hypothetical protein
MHPVACVLITYWNNLRKQHSIFSARFYCAYGGLPIFDSTTSQGHVDSVLCFELLTLVGTGNQMTITHI